LFTCCLELGSGWKQLRRRLMGDGDGKLERVFDLAAARDMRTTRWPRMLRE